MKSWFTTFAALLVVSLCVSAAQAQPEPAQPSGPAKGKHSHTTFIKLGSDRFDGLLYEPDNMGPKARIALVYAYGSPNFDFSPAPEMADRGYRSILIRHYGDDFSPFAGVPEMSRAIAYMRGLPGVEWVIIVGHSGGSRLIAFYADLAENGAKACQGPDLLYPCKPEEAEGLARPDGAIMLDPALGASNSASSFDPAFDDNGQRTIKALDMYAPENGYDPRTGSAHYSADFIRRFNAAQSARNMRYIDAALARLKLIEAGKGRFTDDEPFTIPGAVTGGNGTRLFHTDLSLQEHTHAPHLLLKADGTTPMVVVHSIRPASGLKDSQAVGSMSKGGAMNTTVRTFLANYAMRTGPDYAFGPDSITGMDWHSSNKSAPASAEGITVPALVETMTCNSLMVPGEVLYDHLASKDKTYVAVEGAVHTFTPCRPEFGNTKKRTFDYVDLWLSQPGRFPPANRPAGSGSNSAP